VIDPSARVDATASLGAKVAVGPDTVVAAHARLGPAVVLGAETRVGLHVVIEDGVRVGNRVQIQDGAIIQRGAVIEDGVLVGADAILANERYPRAITAKGEIAREVDRVIEPIVLAYGCSIGAGAVIVAGCTVGRFATVGAGSVVTRSIGSHALAAGSPARRIGWVCACGGRLHDANGAPAPAEVERYASDPILTCARCGRRYAYVSDDDSLAERGGPVVPEGALSL
jgi:UDP-2-acetamido-3-amino-2,3-dideoxy-glucuronate N-acetyltransferase